MPKSPLQLWVDSWKACTRCELSKTRSNVVHGRGSVPCDVLFIGEAPGDSEDAVGQPFVGPAGQVLDQIIEQAIPRVFLECPKGNDPPYDGPLYTFAICNLVGCIPRTHDGVKSGEPDYEEIEACRPRLERFVKMADPKLIVTVGKMAWEYTEPGVSISVKFHKDIPRVDIIHPAAILRMPWAARGLAVRKAVVNITRAIETHVKGVT